MHRHAQRMWNKVGSGSYRGVDLVESLNHKSYHNFYRKSYRLLPHTIQKWETIQERETITLSKRGSVRATSEGGPGGVRRGPGRRPEGAPGGVRRGARRGPKRRPKRTERRSEAKRARALKKSGDSARDCPTFPSIIVKSSSVFDDFREDVFSTTGAMVLHDFPKPPRLCRQFQTTACVQQINRPFARNGCET